MRSIWKGSIAFGLVNVPVKLYSATEDHDIELHQVHDKDGGRIRYQRRCEVCGRVIDFEHISKAYDDGERTVVLTDDDLRSLPEERSREIEVVEFVPSDQVDPIMFDRSYFLEPDSKSPKAYVLLRRTLEETDRTAIVHFALRQKTRLGALRVRGDVLMLQSLLWDDEVRVADFPSLTETVRISDKELEMSSSLVDSFASDFSPEKFEDDYQNQLRKLVESKIEHGDAVDTEATFGVEAEAEGGEVLDLMEALRRSIAKNKSSETAPATDASPKRAPAKRKAN
jgi:DNA end-binding protein Ku